MLRIIKKIVAVVVLIGTTTVPHAYSNNTDTEMHEGTHKKTTRKKSSLESYSFHKSMIALSILLLSSGIIYIANKSVNTVIPRVNNALDLATDTIDHANTYITELPQVPELILQSGLTSVGLTLTYKGATILQNCVNNDKQASSYLIGGILTVIGLSVTLNSSLIAKKFTRPSDAALAI